MLLVAGLRFGLKLLGLGLLGCALIRFGVSGYIACVLFGFDFG